MGRIRRVQGVAVIALLGFFLALLVAGASKGAPGKATPDGDKGDNGASTGGDGASVSSQGLAAFRELAARGNLTREQTDFLAFVAYGESGLRSDVGLGDPSMFPEGTQPNTRASEALQAGEARAARRAFENAGWLQQCVGAAGVDPLSYQFGSGGYFAFIPTYAVAQFRNTTLECSDGFAVFDPAFAIAAAYGFARGLTQRSGYLGTYASLRSGWGYPAKIGDLERISRKAAKWRRHLAAVGLPESRLFADAPAFPARDLVQLYAMMQGVA